MRYVFLLTGTKRLNVSMMEMMKRFSHVKKILNHVILYHFRRPPFVIKILRRKTEEKIAHQVKYYFATSWKMIII